YSCLSARNAARSLGLISGPASTRKSRCRGARSPGIGSGAVSGRGVAGLAAAAGSDADGASAARARRRHSRDGRRLRTDIGVRSYARGGEGGKVLRIGSTSWCGDARQSDLVYPCNSVPMNDLTTLFDRRLRNLAGGTPLAEGAP